MRKIILLITVTLLLISCGSTKNTSNSNANQNTSVNIGKIKFSGGDGSSMEKAIVILNAKNSRDGIVAEYQYIEKKLGEKFIYWKPLGQALLHKNGKNYDVINVQITANGKELAYYFDITDFFGKF